MRNFEPLGLRPYRVSGQAVPPVTPDQLEAFERSHAVELPATYKALLLHSNGGIPKTRWFATPVAGEQSIEKFFYLGQPESDPGRPVDDGWDYGNLWAETRVRQQVLGPQCIPIGRNGGDDIIFIDFREQPPRIRLLTGDTRQVEEVALQFDEFLDMLR